jgi:hypothetical protein
MIITSAILLFSMIIIQLMSATTECECCDSNDWRDWRTGISSKVKKLIDYSLIINWQTKVNLDKIAALNNDIAELEKKLNLKRKNYWDDYGFNTKKDGDERYE